MMMFNASFVCLYLMAAVLLKPCCGFHVRQQQHKLPYLKGSPLLASPSSSTQESSNALNTVTPAGTTTASRRDLLRSFGTSSAAVAFSLLVNEGYSSQPAFAFDGSGASASSGLSPATKAEKKKRFQERVVADVRDFNTLGKTIDSGETQGPGWVNFFILFQRREADSVGRTYAALVDLRGLPTKKSNEFEGGGGLLLANTFTKQGKPPDNTPAVKSFLKLSKTFDAIQAAGKAGDAVKAKKEWLKTSELFSQYLSDVELPGDLNDPLYK
mmetsp:Transcript_9729/g.21016  ORF Transcript_9729/g.21016 Transcript_9729/m.21016 type:complete len:270 (-) Transcript_9729:215-1024(-)